MSIAYRPVGCRAGTPARRGGALRAAAEAARRHDCPGGERRSSQAHHGRRPRERVTSVATVDRTCNEGCRVRAEEQREVGKFILRAIAPERHALLDALAGFGCRREPPHAFGVIGRPGRDAIRANARRPPLDCEGLHKQLDTCFGGANVRLGGKCRAGRYRSRL
jgi:hypothetical protein